MIPGLGRSPGEGKGYPLQYSGLENSMDCIVHGVSKSLTLLSYFKKMGRGAGWLGKLSNEKLFNGYGVSAWEEQVLEMNCSDHRTVM